MSQISRHFNRRGPASTLNFILSEFQPTCMYNVRRCNVCALNIHTTHFIPTFTDMYVLECVWVCVCFYSSVFHFHLAFVANTNTSVHSLEFVLVPKLQNTTILLRARLHFIFQQVDSKFDSWLLRKEKITIRDEVYSSKYRVHLYIYVHLVHHPELDIAAYVCACVYIAWHICLATNHRFTTIRLKQPWWYICGFQCTRMERFDSQR